MLLNTSVAHDSINEHSLVFYRLYTLVIIHHILLLSFIALAFLARGSFLYSRVNARSEEFSNEQSMNVCTCMQYARYKPVRIRYKWMEKGSGEVMP